MRDLNRWFEENAMSEGPDPRPQLDVLDLWLAVVPLVVHAGFGEDYPSNGARSGPEGLDLTGVPVMDVVMGQVAILGHNAGRRRHRVIRTKGSAQLRPRGEQRREAGQGISVHDAVGVDEHDDVAPSHLETTVPRIRRAVRGPGQRDHGIGITGGNE